MTTTAASRQALGAYGETLAARFLTTEQGMVAARPQLALPERRARPGPSRRRRRWSPARSRPGAATAAGRPTEAVDQVSVERLHRLAVAWAEAHDVRPAHVRVDVVALLAPRRGAAIVDHVAGVA